MTGLGLIRASGETVSALLEEFFGEGGSDHNGWEVHP